MVEPDLTTGPAPLISSWTTRVVGGAVLGTVICAALAPSTVAVGSPALGGTAAPVAAGSVVLAETTAIRNRAVSVGPNPACALPWAPNASAGGIATSNVEPIFCPVRPLLSPGSSEADDRSRPAVCLPKLDSTCLPSLPLARM